MKNRVIKEINELLSAERNLSRTDIAKLTDTSYSTITKFTDILVEQDILKVRRSNAKKGTIKSNRYNLHPSKYFIVFDLNDRVYKAHFCSLAGKIKNTFVYHLSQEHSFEEDRYYFLKNIKFLIDKYSRNKLCGQAIILADGYDENLIQHGRINSLINSIANDKHLIVEKDRYLKAKYTVEQLKDNDFSLLLLINKDAFINCYLTHDTDIDKILFASVGDNITYKNIPLKDYVEYLEDPVSIVEQFSSVIDSILKTVPVNKVYISGNLFTHMDSLTALISENFTSLDIEFKHINYKNYIQYVAKLLRDSISEAIISNYLSK